MLADMPSNCINPYIEVYENGVTSDLIQEMSKCFYGEFMVSMTGLQS